MSMLPRLRPTWRVPALAGAATLVAGFGGMSALQAFGSYDKNLRGLYSYLSASFGDALCLPVITAALVSAIRSTAKAPQEELFAAIGAILGAVGSGLTQLAWVADPDPDLNWTLPEPHQLSVAGYYHAAFMLAQSTATGFCLGMAACRAISRREWRHEFDAVLIAGAIFFILVVIDNLVMRATDGSKATLMAVTLGFVSVLIGALAMRKRINR